MDIFVDILAVIGASFLLLMIWGHFEGRRMEKEERDPKKVQKRLAALLPYWDSLDFFMRQNILINIMRDLLRCIKELDKNFDEDSKRIKADLNNQLNEIIETLRDMRSLGGK